MIEWWRGVIIRDTAIDSGKAIESATSWLGYIGVSYGTTPGLTCLPDNSAGILYSYEGCIYLAEHMPEEYERWRTLYRLGAAT